MANMGGFLNSLKLGAKSTEPAASTASKVVGKGASRYGEISPSARTAANEWKSTGGALNGVTSPTFAGRVSNMGSWAAGNLKQAGNDANKSILGMAGSHAVKGAAWGAAIGGTTEAVQGGSFWDGAKSGAFNGAVGWTGYRMGMKAVGANKLNPLNKSGGMVSAGSNMWRNTSVSNQATAILNNRQMEGVARSIMNK